MATLAATQQGGTAAEIPSRPLEGGKALPMLGLGCAAGVRKEHVLSALRLGYTHLDTAQAYHWGYHEDEVGAAVEESGIARESLFIQTKIYPQDLGYQSTLRSFNESLGRLRSDSVDSVLIHKPRCWGDVCSRQPEGTWQDSWRALEELYEAGRARAIGICDVDEGILQQLSRMKHNAHVIQNWMDPLHQDKHVRWRCKELGIQYQAYSTLGTQWRMQGHKGNPVLANPTLQRIASDHGRDVAQVVLNWAVRHGVAVIPASKQEQRQRSNLASLGFELTPEEMAEIDGLDGSLDRSRRESGKSDDGQIVVTFKAAPSLTESLSVVWVDPVQGEAAPSGEVPPGSSHAVGTYDGHRFRFKSGGKVVGEHVVSRKLDPEGLGRYTHVVGIGQAGQTSASSGEGMSRGDL